MDNSPLAKLPAELRNYIYELALTCDTPCRVRSVGLNPQLLSPEQRQPLGLTATCKAIRAEPTKLFYANNSFVFTNGDSDCAFHRDQVQWFQIFAGKVGKANASVLQSVTIDVGRFDIVYAGTRSLLVEAVVCAARLAKRYPNCDFSVKARIDVSYTMGYPMHEMKLHLYLKDLKRSFGQACESVEVQRAELDGNDAGATA